MSDSQPTAATWLVADIEREGDFVHATSANHALAEHFDSLGLSLTGDGVDGWEARRAEHMDDLPLTNWMMLSVGGLWSVPCACGREIWRDPGDGHVIAGDEDGRELAPHLVGDELFCSPACAAALYDVVAANGGGA